MKDNRIAAVLFLAAQLVVIAHAARAAERIVVTSEDGGIVAREAGTSIALFRHADARLVIEWAMSHAPVTVIESGTFRVSEPVRVPRPDIALLVGEQAVIELDIDSLPRARPYAPWTPVIYNQSNDNVTVVNLGTLLGQPKSGGVGILFDGRAGGLHGLRGGRIVSTGMQGIRPGLGGIAALVDCAEVEIPMLVSDGYRNAPLEMEGCRDTRIGLVVAAPRASPRPVTLLGRNENTHIRKVIAAQPLDQAVLVRNSTGTVVDESVIVGDPLQFVKLFHVHEYTPGSGRFTLRPHIPDSAGSRVLKESIVNRKVADWPQPVALVDFPQSLPRIVIDVALDAVYTDGDRERIFQERHEIDLLTGEASAHDQEPLFVSREGGIALVRSGQSGETRFTSADTREALHWAMANSPITVLEAGSYTVPGTVTIPRPNVSLLILEGAELAQDPNIVIDVMPGGRGGYRPLIHNPGHDHVEIINLGTLRAHPGMRGVGIHMDGRRDGALGINGGLVFATGSIFADDAVWVVDAQNVRIPLLSFKGYGNAPLALEGCEDMEIGTLTALMGDSAFENEALDFNSYCQRVRVGKVIGTTPAEEIVDVNNSRDCVIDEIRVYRSRRDVMPVRVFDHPPDDTRGAVSRASLRPFLRSSGSAVSQKEMIIEEAVTGWSKRVDVAPLADTSPTVEIRFGLDAQFEGGTRPISDEALSLTLVP